MAELNQLEPLTFQLLHVNYEIENYNATFTSLLEDTWPEAIMRPDGWIQILQNVKHQLKYYASIFQDVL